MTAQPYHRRGFDAGRVLAALFLALAAVVSASATTDEGDVTALELSPGGSTTLSFETDVATASVASAETADVQVLDARRLFVLGRAPGITSLVVYDGDGNAIGEYTVRVHAQPVFARAVADRMAGDPEAFEVEALGDALLVMGEADSPAQAERVLRGIRAVSGDTPVVDAISLATPAQVNLEVLISEVNRNVTEVLGIDWSLDLNPFIDPLRTWVTGTGLLFGSGAFDIRPDRQQTVTFTPVLPDGTAGEGPQFVNEVAELAVLSPAFRGGEGGFVLSHAKEVNSGKYRASTFLDTLAENGLAFVHARPNLTAVSGESANFFSGLEIPVPAISGQGVISTQYRQTGVSLTFTPTVINREQISLVVEPRIREVAAGGATIAGTVVPNINERSASTTVELGDGESIAIAGLYRHTTTDSASGIPLLRDIPLWGALFRQSNHRETSVELIIVVTPRIVAAVRPATAGLALADTAAGAARRGTDFYY